VLFAKGDMTGLVTDISFMYAHLRLRNYWTKKYDILPLYFPNSVVLGQESAMGGEEKPLHRLT
jgi:hypothetical protein